MNDWLSIHEKGFYEGNDVFLYDRKSRPVTDWYLNGKYGHFQMLMNAKEVTLAKMVERVRTK